MPISWNCSAESRQTTPLGHTDGDFGERPVLARCGTWQPVDTASHAFELVGLHQACQRDGWQSLFGDISGAQELAFAHEAHELLLVGGLGGTGRCGHGAHSVGIAL